MAPHQSERNDETRFLVTTPGVSATRWLSFVLVDRPDVFVAHGKHSLESVIRGTFADERGADDAGSLALGNIMSDFYRCRALPEVFEIYRLLKPAARAWGNVHTYTLEEVSQRFGQLAGGIRVVNVLRHPITYIASHTALVRSARAYPTLRRHYEDAFAGLQHAFPKSLVQQADNPEEFAAFAVSCASAARVQTDLVCDWAPHVRMEDLTGDVEQLGRLCEYVTGLAYDRERLRKYIQDGPINSHRRSARRASPAEVYQGWADWQRHVAALLLRDELLEQFEAHGYDVSMLYDANRRAVSVEQARRLRLAAQLSTTGRAVILPLPGAVFDSERPTLVEHGYRGFNVVRFRAQHYVLAQALGHVEMSQLDDAWLAAKRQARQAAVTDSLQAARQQIDHWALGETGSPRQDRVASRAS